MTLNVGLHLLTQALGRALDEGLALRSEAGRVLEETTAVLEPTIAKEVAFRPAAGLPFKHRIAIALGSLL